MAIQGAGFSYLASPIQDSAAFRCWQPAKVSHFCWLPTDQSQSTETRTQETKTFIRQVRTKTRRKYAPEDQIRIVLEGFRREVTVSDLCNGRGSTPKPPFSTRQSTRFVSTEIPGELVAGRMDSTPTPDTLLLLPSGIRVSGVESWVRKLADVA